MNLKLKTHPATFAVVICGPSASGKTSTAINLANKINGEIISADSRQVYRYLDIGTNKEGIFSKEKDCRIASNIPQHLTDIINPDEFFDAGKFVELAKEKICEIINNGKVPIIVGGTGLYIKALTEGLAPAPPRDNELRAQLNSIVETHGLKPLYEELKKVDADLAEKNRQNPQRLIRSIEVLRLCGKSPSQLSKENKPLQKELFIKFALKTNRDILYKKINNRTDEMLKQGLIDETKKVIAMGYAKGSAGLKTIGYKESVLFLDGKLTLKQTAELIKTKTRNYAKRQLTWFAKDNTINWIDPSLGISQQISQIIITANKKLPQKKSPYKIFNFSD